MKLFQQLALLLMAIGVSGAAFSWSSDTTVNTGVATTGGNYIDVRLCADSNGGFFAVYTDQTNFRTYVQHFDAAGTASWTAPGQRVFPSSSTQSGSRVASDGAGGIIVVCQDTRGSVTSEPNLWAQRMDTTGTLLWGNSGYKISHLANTNYQHEVVPDGSGGVWVTWVNTASPTAICSQRVDSSGSPFASDVVVDDDSTTFGYNPKLCSDGSGGTFICWETGLASSTADIYSQRVDSSGTRMWTSAGVSVTSATNAQSTPAIVADGLNGAVITWADLRSGSTYDVYAQRIDATGTTAWADNGVAVSTASNNQYSPQLVKVASEAWIIAFLDTRNVSPARSVYAQKLNGSGATQWASDTQLGAQGNNPSTLVIAADESGGAIVSWDNPDIQAQIVDGAGSLGWSAGANGVTISNASGNQLAPSLVSDTTGGGFLAWRDFRSGSSARVYAAHVSSAGLVPVVFSSFAVE